MESFYERLEELSDLTNEVRQSYLPLEERVTQFDLVTARLAELVNLHLTKEHQNFELVRSGLASWKTYLHHFKNRSDFRQAECRPRSEKDSDLLVLAIRELPNRKAIDYVRRVDSQLISGNYNAFDHF